VHSDAKQARVLGATRFDVHVRINSPSQRHFITSWQLREAIKPRNVVIWLFTHPTLTFIRTYKNRRGGHGRHSRAGDPATFPIRAGNGHTQGHGYGHVGHGEERTEAVLGSSEWQGAKAHWHTRESEEFCMFFLLVSSSKL
jgi:hypothetical protein